MADEREQELKLLERALQNQDSARQTFFRDLKIAAVLLLGFQFLIFFRFVDLKGHAHRLEQQMTPLRADQADLNAVRENLASVKEAVQGGQKQLAALLRAAPTNMRSQLQRMGNDIATIRLVPTGSPAGGATSSVPLSIPNSAPQLPPNLSPPDIRSGVSRLPPSSDEPITGRVAPFSANLRAGQFPPNMQMRPPDEQLLPTPGLTFPGPEFFIGLSDRERQTLGSADTDGAPFRELLYRLVETRIVKPTFDSLDERVKDLLGKPLAERKTALLQALRNRSDLLTKHGLDAAEMEKRVETLSSTIALIRIRPPAPTVSSESDQPMLEPWWTTFEGKTGAFETREADTDHVIQRTLTELEGPEKQLAEVSDALAALLAETEAKQVETSRNLKELEKQSEHIQSLLGNFAAPLPVISLGLEDAVVYYPVVLAAIFCYFVSGYLRLRRRGRDLAATCRAFGLSDRVVRTYFTELPADGPLAIQFPVPTYGAAVLLWGMPGVLAALSIYCVLNSTDLSGSAPRLLYVLAGGSILVAYFVLAVGTFGQQSKRKVSLRDT